MYAILMFTRKRRLLFVDPQPVRKITKQKSSYIAIAHVKAAQFPVLRFSQSRTRT